MLHDDLIRHGDACFRWRSLAPLLLAPLVALELMEPGLPFDSPLADQILRGVCLGLVLLGIGVRALVQGYVSRGTSGKNTRKQKAEVLNTAGLYSLCRNPLYLGNAIIILGVFLRLHSVPLLVVAALGFCLYYERIILREEAFLLDRFGEEYTDWARDVPVFFPRRLRWVKPDRPFSWRTVLRREHPTLLGSTLSVLALEVAARWSREGEVTLDAVGIGILAFVVSQYVVLRVLKKTTRLLKLPRADSPQAG